MIASLNAVTVAAAGPVLRFKTAGNHPPTIKKAQ
jgi:hypothetical protein